MTEAIKDNNKIPAILGTSSADGSTPVILKAIPSSHKLKTEDAHTGSDLSGDIAPRDANGNPAIIALSSADGVTPVQVYANSSTGALLIDHT